MPGTVLESGNTAVNKTEITCSCGASVGRRGWGGSGAEKANNVNVYCVIWVLWMQIKLGKRHKEFLADWDSCCSIYGKEGSPLWEKDKRESWKKWVSEPWGYLGKNISGRGKPSTEPRGGNIILCKIMEEQEGYCPWSRVDKKKGTRRWWHGSSRNQNHIEFWSLLWVRWELRVFQAKEWPNMFQNICLWSSTVKIILGPM